LRSIQRQTFSDFECITSDNDPAGSGRPVIEGLKDPRFRYYCNEQDLGMNASFNRSLSRATGQFVVMITDDDPIYPEMLETLRELVDKHPNLGAYYGGCDVLQLDPEIASFTLHRVGTNSTLAPLPYGTVRGYSADTYPHAFFTGELQMYTLWSTGMVRREIAQAVGGLPNYGSAFLGDFAYVVSTCSRSGCAIINRSLGCQTVHASNFGRKECAEMKTAAVGFVECLTKEFSHRSDWPELRPKLERFAGQAVVLHSLFLRQYFRHYRIKDHDLNAALKDMFRVPYIRRLRAYYYLGGAFMAFQQLQANLRRYGLRRLARPK